MDLADILDLEAVGEGTWQASIHGGPPVFGGEVAALSLRAAFHAVDADWACSSVHCLFLRRGDAAAPVRLQVTAVRTGRTYATRQVEALQGERTIFTMLATFHADEPGGDHQQAMPAGVPGPDELGGPAHPRSTAVAPAVEVRRVDTEGPLVRWWGRIEGPIPDDVRLHQCGLLYASDLHAGGAAMAAAGVRSGLVFDAADSAPADDTAPAVDVGSLDHSLWFHRHPVADDWFFCDVRPLAVHDSRGLVIGTIFDRGGQHLATFTQEIFLKPRQEDGTTSGVG